MQLVAPATTTTTNTTSLFQERPQFYIKQDIFAIFFGWSRAKVAFRGKMSGRSGVGQTRGASLGPQPLKATIPYQLASKARPNWRDGKSGTMCTDALVCAIFVHALCLYGLLKVRGEKNTKLQTKRWATKLKLHIGPGSAKRAFVRLVDKCSAFVHI